MTRTEIEAYFADRGHIVTTVELSWDCGWLAILDEDHPDHFGDGIMNRGGRTADEAMQRLYDHYVRTRSKPAPLGWF